MFSMPANFFQICQTFPFPIILRGFTEGKWKMCLFYDRKQTLTNLINHTSFERNDLRIATSGLVISYILVVFAEYEKFQIQVMLSIYT